ncbi:LuxR C-terminal-related transcriptional regulator [Streptomyces sp. NPDC093675]|uniref:helix-turn-helix transcriptional regulator n=1 Tax=Streptomyces sp. NPDC093675 TaxID=3366049 RepID=UPI0038078D23
MTGVPIRAATDGASVTPSHASDACEPPVTGGLPLDGLSITAPELRLYYLLVRQPRASIVELMSALDASEADVRQRLDSLRAHQLASRAEADDGQPLWEARPPSDQLDEAFIVAEQNLGRLRDQYRMLRQLNELYWRQHASQLYDGVEVLFDQVVVLETLVDLQRRARRQVRVFDRPPYYSDSRPGWAQAQWDVQAGRMRRGVVYRAIYEPQTWDHPDHGAKALAGIADGEQARSLSGLPMKMFLIDDERAIVPLDPAHHSDTATLMVHPSGLLRALADMFEFYWAHATPVSPHGLGIGADEITDRDRAILTLLAAGGSDDLIARRMFLSRSTVTRAVSDLQRRSGTTTRFQLGAHAARENWI